MKLTTKNFLHRARYFLQEVLDSNWGNRNKHVNIANLLETSSIHKRNVLNRQERKKEFTAWKTFTAAYAAAWNSLLSNYHLRTRVAMVAQEKRESK